MACLNADGSLTPIAEGVLRAVGTAPAGATPESVHHATGLPLYRVRASLRELLAAGLLEERTGTYRLTAHAAKLDSERQASVRHEPG